jgi:hypothetical protein
MRWTQTEPKTACEYVKMHDDGCTVAEIAEDVAASRTTVYQITNGLRRSRVTGVIAKLGRQKKDCEWYDEFFARVFSGEGVNRVAESMGIHRSLVYYHRRTNGVFRELLRYAKMLAFQVYEKVDGQWVRHYYRRNPNRVYVEKKLIDAKRIASSGGFHCGKKVGAK